MKKTQVATIIILLIAGVAAMARADTKKIVKEEKAVFAGGCFWCMQPVFQRIDGVKKVTSGYTGGKKPNPTYEEVSSGKTGHVEAVEVVYDPDKTRYEDLLDVFWHNIDPTDPGGQFFDRGEQYKTTIFYYTDEQKKIAEASKDALQRSGRFNKPIATGIIKGHEFYPAEEYHQDYGKKNPARYNIYKKGSGREEFINKTWPDKMSKDELRKKLTPIEYNVTQECGTEPAFNNEYWDNHREGIYVDKVSGEVLFSSKDKFDSGTGWPSFTKPLEPGNVAQGEDKSHGMDRTEVKSRGGSHLGHIFPDGPGPSGLRYCINSASLRFIPKEDLEKEGYGKYRKLFEK